MNLEYNEAVAKVLVEQINWKNIEMDVGGFKSTKLGIITNVFKNVQRLKLSLFKLKLLERNLWLF